MSANVRLAEDGEAGQIVGSRNVFDANALPNEKFPVIRYRQHRVAQKTAERHVLAGADNRRRVELPAVEFPP